jgi:AAA domain (dynein-related subfamily)
MSETATAPAVTKEQFQNRFKALTAIINQIGGEAQARVSAHIRALTDGKHVSLGVYHISASIPMEDKFAEYGYIASALGLYKEGDKPKMGKPDWSKLKGQLGAGAKKAEEVETPVRPDPMDKSEKKEAASLSQPPPRTHEQTPVVERNIAPPTHAVKQPTLTTPVPEDAAAATLAALRNLLASGVKAEMDDGKVRLIVEEQLAKLDIAEQVKKANQNGAFPTDRVDKLIKDALANVGVHRIELVQPNGELKPLTGLVHPQVTQAAAWLNADVPVWAWSAAGSGKTHSARQIAEVLGVECYVISVDPTLTVAKLLGYRNVANGDFVEGYIYKAFKHGGLIVLDEIDTGDPGVIASINALLSNTHYLFPNNETVERHPKFRVMAAANTKGTGAVAGYTARNKLDAATLDRFAVIEWKYDAGLETALACGFGSPAAPWKGAAPATEIDQRNYVEWVQKVRAQVGNSVLISPRASINGCKALRAGVPLNEVIEALVFKLVSDDTRKRIVDTCGLPATNL